MRASFCAAGLVIALVVVGWFAFSEATPAPADARKDAKGDDREQLADKLLERVTLKDPLNNVLLKEALGLLMDRHDITILVDNGGFGEAGAAVAVNAEENPILNATINVPAMKNVRLATILKHITDQINGVYLIYPDHIKIVSAAKAFTMTKPTLTTGISEMEQPMESPDALVRSIPLVTVSFGEKNLIEALRDIEVRTNATIILANQAAEKAKTPIQARLTNVPVDTAVATLAEMAGLKLARRGNVLLVTTAERAKDFDPPPPPQPMGTIGGLGVVPQGDAAAELKAQVAELEKELAERKIAELEKKLEELKKGK